MMPRRTEKDPGGAPAVDGKKLQQQGRVPSKIRWCDAYIRRPCGEETQDERQERLLPHRNGRIERI